MTAPHWATGRNGESYVFVSIYPQTTDELRKLCRDFGEAAVSDYEWGCVTAWLMSGPDASDLRNPLPVTSLAVRMVRDQERICFDWPRHDGGEWNASGLDRLSPDVRAEAILVAAETASDWGQAGRPYSGRRKLNLTYRYLTTCPAFINQYVRPLDDNEDQE